MTIEQTERGEELLGKVQEYLPPKGVALVQEALAFAEKCHAGQTRRSGDPVITHPLHAATTIAALQLDAATIAAALLHDVQEDCEVGNESIQKLFGGEVATLVEGVTKLGQIPWQAPEVRVVSPPDGGAEVGINAVIRVRLSEALNPLTVREAAVRVNDGSGDLVACNVTLVANNTRIDVVPHDLLTSSTAHTITVEGVTDVAGNRVVPLTSTFTESSLPTSRTT
ncbi:MAG: HD domain-containing protein, partial [Armatimonadota bacterium]